MSEKQLELTVKGMDCAECTMHVKNAISEVSGVDHVDVLLGAEKAIISTSTQNVDMSEIQKAVKAAGYDVLAEDIEEPSSINFTRQITTLFGAVFGAVLFIVVVGEWLGLFEELTSFVPWYVWLVVLIAAGFPIFKNVIRVSLRGQIISHTLMTVGALAAMIAGEWTTAAIVVFFMRVGDYVESFTADRARGAVKSLASLAPKTARVERNNEEEDIPLADIRVDDVVISRPGEKIPVDGIVLLGQASVNQSAITGESIPIEAIPGKNVYAASIIQTGSLKIRTTHIGPDTTFGRIIKMVEEAEANRADVQRIADKFSAYYLPIVAVIAILTFALRRDLMATVAVLVVACSCSFALATPIAMLASIGAAAKQGLLIKGGRFIEVLDQATILLLDKTGTLTLGTPQITDVIPHTGSSHTESDLLQWAASAERYSEHPLAEATLLAAKEQRIDLFESEDFKSIPGQGIAAIINGSKVKVGNARLIPNTEAWDMVNMLEEQGKALLFVSIDDEIAGVLAASDTLRPEVPKALSEISNLGIEKIELLTGDHEKAGATLANELNISYQANLLPEDKIRIVREYQENGKVVIMVGDGVNDAPALAQANVGIAMGGGGTDIAVEAGHIALLRDDWNLIPNLFRIAQHTMRVVKQNIIFTAIYNTLGLTLAAFGIIPPVLAAAAQSIPDIGILGNSSRLIDRT
jgi:Cd2+/Zn2+-exporting ATPase/Cu+-exporting ATPase